MAIIAVVISVNFVACSSDDDDENESNSPLVGTWVNIENRNSVEYKDVMTINADGTGSDAIYINGQLDKDGVDNFKYTYDEKSKVFTWIWEEDSDGESDVYSMHVQELTSSKLVDAMTATIEPVDWPILMKITDRILKEVKNVNRVCYDMSPKPNATIEWE